MNAHHLQALVADRQAELHRDAAIRRATHDVASRGEFAAGRPGRRQRPDRALIRAHQASNSATASGRAASLKRAPCASSAARLASV
jgi:hypothetical protein